MEVDRTDGSQNPKSAVRESNVKNKKVKEGCFLLGSPTFLDLGNGRWRCEESGHDLTSMEKESYSQSRACRLALIDAALVKKKPPLNTFRPHPVSKSMLVCSLTGDVINKSEEHIWKHINGRQFLKKLEDNEAGIPASPEKIEIRKKTRNKKILKASSILLEVDGNGSPAREPDTGSTDAEGPDFWVPPIGKRWDFDDGRDRWELCSSFDQGTQAEDNTGSVNKKNEAESMELSMRTKRLAIAVGPNSFARKKKKMKKA